MKTVHQKYFSIPTGLFRGCGARLSEGRGRLPADRKAESDRKGKKDMSNKNEMNQTREEILENIQKAVLCGRAMLDAIEKLTYLYFTAEEPHAACTHDGDESDRVQPANETDQATREKTASLEQVRGLLAEKSRSGYRAEVKALLTTHGVERLSDISDPAELGKLLEEAAQIGAP